MLLESPGSFRPESERPLRLARSLEQGKQCRRLLVRRLNELSLVQGSHHTGGRHGGRIVCLPRDRAERRQQFTPAACSALAVGCGKAGPLGSFRQAGVQAAGQDATVPCRQMPEPIATLDPKDVIQTDLEWPASEAGDDSNTMATCMR